MKKPRTKWIHADEMAFLKQYLKRNRYHNNNLEHHELSSSLMFKDEEELSNFENHLINLSTTNRHFKDDHSFHPVDIGQNHQQLLSTKKIADYSSYSDQDNHVDVENCEDNGEIDDEECFSQQDKKDVTTSSFVNGTTASMMMTMMMMNTNNHGHDNQPEDCSMAKANIQKFFNGHYKFDKIINKEFLEDLEIMNMEPSTANAQPTSTNEFEPKNKNYREKMKRITLEAPESVLICFNQNHHRNFHLSKTQNSTIENEFDIFSEFVSMKLKTFSLSNRLEVMNKIWNLLSDTTLREYSSTSSSPSPEHSATSPTNPINDEQPTSNPQATPLISEQLSLNN